MQILLLGIIIIAAVVLFISRWLALEVTSILVVTALALTGILEPTEALQGFSSVATITVAGMFVLSAGLHRTGALDLITRGLIDHCSTSTTRMLLVFAPTIVIASAFMNNTPLVILMVPVVLTVCQRSRNPASKLLIPISYFAILGGTCTLIGTSTNLLVDDVFRKAGGPGFGIFDFSGFGLIYAAVGSLFVVLLGPRLLPERASLSAFLLQRRQATFVTEVVLQEGSPLIGRTFEDVVSKSESIQFREAVRKEEIFIGRRLDNLVLAANDALMIEGSPQDITNFLNSVAGVELASVVEDEQRVPMKTLALRLVEAVVLPDSAYLGRQVREIGLNRLYGVKVMAVERRGRAHRYLIRTLRLREGDVLLLQADDHGIAALREAGEVMIVEGVEETVYRSERKIVAIAVMASVVIAASLFRVPLALATMAGVALMLATRCLRVDEALRSLDVTTLLLLAGTIPLGVAMMKTGLADSVVDKMVLLVGHSSPRILISAIYLLAAIVTAFLSNNAAAVLLTPIAIQMAATLDVNPIPLVLAVLFGSSCDFATPIGYQTNMIVLGPGGYTFGDYARLGIPVSIALWLLATWLIPVFWPL